MKKIISILVLGLFVLGGIGAAGIKNNYRNESIANNNSSRDYTHTVLVEVGSRSTCPACPSSNLAWHNIYIGGNYNFEYTELVYDKNSKAAARFNQFNPKWVPTSYWDGGEYVYPGTNYATFYNYLDASGSRSVPNLVASLNVTWQGNGQIEISYNVDNNEATNYPGRLRIYINELESTLWTDYNGNAYSHAFLEFAVNQAIDIPATGSISDLLIWDGQSAGYPGVTPDNLQVILAVFNDTPSQSYSDPPSGNPFWAYYSDECIAAIPEQLPNDPPEIPDINGPPSGKKGASYDYIFTSTDPDGDNVKLYIKWGDGNTDWTDFEASGTPITVSHTWSSTGSYTIEAKAVDTSGAESGWAIFEVSIPKYKMMSFNSLIIRLLQRFSSSFPIIKQLISI